MMVGAEPKPLQAVWVLFEGGKNGDVSAKYPL